MADTKGHKRGQVRAKEDLGVVGNGVDAHQLEILGCQLLLPRVSSVVETVAKYTEEQAGIEVKS